MIINKWKSNFFNWVSEKLFPFLIKEPGIIAAHFLQGDKEASQTETEEKALREKPDQIADWIIFIESI